jgi:hypothetical protein
MSVEDRLRRGLELNARALVPEGEQRLVEVRRRHRARTGTLAAAVAAVVVAAVLAGASILWSSDRDVSPEPAPEPTQGATSENASTGPRIPDSEWRKVVTRGQFVRAGVDGKVLADTFGRTERLPVSLNFAGVTFTQSSREPDGWAVGDAGTVTYAPDGRLVLTSTSSGCTHCIGSMTWRIRGNRLVLDDFRGTPPDRVSRVLVEGVWTRFGT